MLTSIPDLMKIITPNQRRIDAEQAKQELEQNHGLLIDVREPAEHATKAATGAINIPRGLLEMKLMEIEKDPTRAIYLHCASSARATLSAEALTRVGYENVTVITCKADTICQVF
ncbi:MULTISPECIES: rhodanese-like domain-containing protein [unclassified Pseudoalteromonas]|uniref:rhodanese-like domain-containing protein n=1 Tax=unclassified Pseudoalteromonas TaxID=194690 RepID=UPI0025B3E88A|nr:MULTISPECIES: rhodanese-like domain-containing protein [unclassified Pseudoalteromonas]MDN3378609.1 rhodanese-like domain-containing protein [Pseudoalteromonas sp. APC 3893]MDN3386979.1 rhodanese-like domain-containing protein [Pseudoalteromonas sp. APC 4017]